MTKRCKTLLAVIVVVLAVVVPSAASASDYTSDSGASVEAGGCDLRAEFDEITFETIFSGEFEHSGCYMMFLCRAYCWRTWECDSSPSGVCTELYCCEPWFEWYCPPHDH